MPPHQRPDQGPAGRLPFARVSPLRSSRVYRNLCGNQLGGSLTWRHKGRTILKECWSDLANGFGKADTECGSDASKEIHEGMLPRKVLGDVLVVLALVHLQ